MSAKTSNIRRSRDGCWTCKRRRKKCNSYAYPCANCQRLNLECEMGTRLVWEDDPRREGMSRRGPVPKASRTSGSGSFDEGQHPCRHGSKEDDGAEAAVTSQQCAPVWDSTAGSSHATALVPPMGYQISSWQFELEETESRLLNNYIQRFSRTYPTCSGPENPFLSIFIPLSMRNRVVLDSILALTSVQSWANGVFEMECPMLRLHQKAIQGCIRLVRRVINISDMQKGGNIVLSELQNSISGVALPVATTASAIDDVLALLASCLLLLLYEKLSSGDQVAATPHLQLFVRLVPVRALLSIIGRKPDGPHNVTMHPFDRKPWAGAFRFFSSLFLYNDLVRSTSSHLPTLSEFYLGEDTGPEAESFLYKHTFHNQELLEHGLVEGRYSLPNIIARLSAGDCLVSDEDIAAWNGRLDWFPSFALIHARSESGLDLYERIPTADPDFVLNSAFHSLKSFMPLGEWRDEAIVRELYRIAAAVYRRQCVLQRFIETEEATTCCAWTMIDSDMNTNMGNLPFWAIELLQLLPPGSPWENCLLWPIGVVAKVLVTHVERNYVLFRLVDLEKRFQIRLYHVVRQQLLNVWSTRDKGISCLDNCMPVLCG